MMTGNGAAIRVLHVIPSLSMVHGGPSLAIRAMERALSAAGIACETATTDDDGPGCRLERALGTRIEEEGALRWYFRKSTELYKVSWSFVPWMLREVRRFDVVHVHALFSFTSVAAAWIARRAGLPFVIRPLGVLAPYGVSRRRPLLKRMSLWLVEGSLLRDAAAVHFTSESERDEALRLGIPMRAAVIPLGIDRVDAGEPWRFRQRWPQVGDRPIVLFLSRIDPKKNVEGLIGALALLRSEGIDASLVIAGSGDDAYVDRLRALAASREVGDRIVWLGYVTGEAKSDALAAADVFALPSLSENFGIALVEAMTAGLPCVVGRGVALAAMVEEAKAGVAVNSESASIAEGLRVYLRSPELRQGAGVAAEALARREFSTAQMGRRLAALYASMPSRRVDAK